MTVYGDQPPPALPPPGWHPDPMSPGVLRWWTGTAWSEHRAPAAPPIAPPVMPVVVVAAPPQPQGTNHLLHLVLTLLTCGLWVIPWLIIASQQPRQPGAPGEPLTPRQVWIRVGVIVAVALPFFAILWTRGS